MIFAFKTPRRGRIDPSKTPAPLAGGQEFTRASIVDRAGSNRSLWFVCLAIYVALVVTAYALENPFNAENAVLLIFLSCSCLLSVLVPATGPRGQRFFLLPGMSFAAMLLLPPITANLPVLLANAVYAASRETVAARRVSLLRGSWIFLSTLLGGIAFRIHAGHNPTMLDAIVGSVFFCAIYIIGRRTDVAPLTPDRRTSTRAIAWYRLECLALVASIPIGVFMFLAYRHDRIPGLTLTTALYGLIVLIVHYCFEVAMLREQVKAMERINAVTLAQTSPKRVVERFVQLSAKLIPCDRITLWLTDESRTRLEVVARSPLSANLDGAFSDRSVRFGEGLVGRVADHQHAMIVRDGSNDPRYSEAEEESRLGMPFSVLLLPLVAAGETIGVAQFERDTPQSYGQRDVARVQPLASQAAATIANVRTHQDIYNQSVTDALTGLFNRRHMQSALADERRRAERYGHLLSVIMLDVDGFKNYNDTYGHPQGDVLLKQLADVLRDNLRDVDIVGRYGGEEFIIVLPETGKEEAFQTAERLRNSVANWIFPGTPGENGTTVRKSISLGVATFPIDATDTPELVSKADQALYRAKNAGRYGTISYGGCFPAPSSFFSEGPGAR